MLQNFGEICKICSREDDFLVDLEKCCKMRPWLQKSASIQPRTSPGKSENGKSGMAAARPRGRVGGPPRRRAARRTGHDTITLSEARSRLDRSRFSRPNTHFLAFFKIYKKITFSRANSANFCQKIGKFCKIFDIFWQILQNFAKFSEIRKNFAKFCRIFCRILQKCVDFEKC